ncbi:MAG: NAD(P)/FAD-dependent oxidoreductase [Myxococcales bacterium]|nr:NAD(P)/FAD-dependent oxidoreductase [Myxococcales bacterium]
MMVESRTEVAIIGTGFSGIAIAHRLQKAGKRDFLLLDASPASGGTWQVNRYPGCACDVPSHLYSFSFAPNADWSHVYSAQPEIEAYTARVTDQLGLRDRIRLGCEVTEARWQADTSQWRLTTRKGDVFWARVVVTATGALRIPTSPDLPGRETFQPPTWHTAQWRDDVDLTGKTVAVVGTGASAIQVVPALAERTKQLIVYQRTPAWVMQRRDRPYTAKEKQRFLTSDWRRRLHRARLYVRMEMQAFAFVTAPMFMRLVALLGRRHIRRGIRDPQLAEKVTPSYRPGCKRILLSDDYYPALARPDVEVIDEAVSELEGRTVISASGQRREVDALIWATGFDLTNLLAPMNVVGREGQTLADAWADLPHAYLGAAVPGFPNFFMMTGPNTGLGHNSMIFMIESMVRMVGECVERALAGDGHVVEVTEAAEAAFNRDIQSRLASAIWGSGCRSWYLDDAGNNPILWPGYTFDFWWQTRRVRWQDFRVTERLTSTF